jgi:hypothetical protein
MRSKNPFVPLFAQLVELIDEHKVKNGDGIEKVDSDPCIAKSLAGSVEHGSVDEDQEKDEEVEEEDAVELATEGVMPLEVDHAADVAGSEVAHVVALGENLEDSEDVFGAVFAIVVVYNIVNREEAGLQGFLFLFLQQGKPGLKKLLVSVTVVEQFNH